MHNIFNNIRMNKNAKLLPQLNQLFLQKQSYTSHKKKILEIKKKKPKVLNIRQQLFPGHSRKQSKQVSLRDSKIFNTSKTPKASLNQIPPAILERCRSLGNSVDWMNPYRRKRHIEELKQNERIRSRLESSKSNLKKIKLEKQYQKFARIKQRLMKFQVNPESHKSILKSEKTLNLSFQPLKTPKIQNNTQNKLHRLAENRKTSIANYRTQQRKESNFSVFVKKTYEIKKEGVKMELQQKSKALINYSKMQKNLQKYEKKHEKRLKTDISRISAGIQKTRTSVNYRYFLLTEPQS